MNAAPQHPVTATDWHAAYRAGVRDYLAANPAPGGVDEPCTTCSAPAGQSCTGGCGWRCTSRLLDYLERVDLHRVAADTAGHRAAHNLPRASRARTAHTGRNT